MQAKPSTQRPRPASGPVNPQATQILAKNLKDRNKESVGFGTVVKLNAGFLIVIFGLALATTVATIFNGMRMETVAMSATGRMVTLTPLSEPIVNLKTVSRFIDEAMATSFSLDFANWQRQMTTTRGFWTKNGYAQYELQLQQAKWLERVQSGAVMSFRATGTWVLASEGFLDGARLYTFEAPVSIEFTAEKTSFTTSGVMVLDVVRVSNIDNPAGIQVNRFSYIQK
jgi:hypothetical protein